MPAAFGGPIEQWETFLNGDSLKQQLASRYIYEHLSYAHLYFSNMTNGDVQFFRMVRSTTPPGEPVSIIAGRRPYDDPGTDRVYYRLEPILSAIVDKTHMPYALNDQRMEYWHALFMDTEYAVTEMPGYDPTEASNPFLTFSQIPVSTRYRFMLDEAQFTIMASIKGPVCRGQVAVDVIDDRFWVFFVNPDLQNDALISTALQEETENLELPAST